MNDPLDYSNVGADFVMDEEERSRRLTNEQIEAIRQWILDGAEGNSSPMANAGPDQMVTTGSLVDLDSNGSSDADGDLLPDPVGALRGGDATGTAGNGKHRR